MAITLKNSVFWTVAIALAVATACKDDDDDDGGGAAGEGGSITTTGGTGGRTGGTGGRTGGTGGRTGGTGGGMTGGEAGSGVGGTTGGSAGEATVTGGSAGTPGGAGTPGTAGAAGTPAEFWADAYDPGGLPEPAEGGPSPTHGVGEACGSCHDGSGGPPAFLFGGTVYEADGSTGAANVQVGVLVGTTLYTTYSAENGNFWVLGDPGDIDWPADDIRLRNENGGIANDNHGGTSCNQCHTGGIALTEPQP